jgi:hypothetical protein
VGIISREKIIVGCAPNPFNQLTRAGLTVKHRFKPKVREKAPLGVKNTFLGNTKQKK